MAITLSQIREFDTCVYPEQFDHRGPVAIHESTLRSFQILQKVKELISAGTPSQVLMQIIEDLETAPTSRATTMKTEASTDIGASV